MRRVLCLAASAAWTLVCAGSAIAHDGHNGHCHGLCHHWENPAYVTEMRIQMAAIALAVCATVLWTWRARRRNRPRRSVGS